MSLFLRDEEAKVLVNVVRNHLWVCLLILWRRMFEGRDDDASIACGDWRFKILEPVLMKEGIIALIPELFAFHKVGEFSAEDSVLHVSVRLYYNWHDHY